MNVMQILNHWNAGTRDYTAACALASLGLLLLFLALNRAALAGAVRTYGRAFRLAALLFILALVIRLALPHRHVIFIDEFVHMETARNLLLHHIPGATPKSMGWPVLLALAFSLFGISNHVAMIAASVFGALCVLPMFFLALALFEDSRPALVSALIMALLPLNIFWSGTAAQDPAALFFVLLCLWLCLLFFRTARPALLPAVFFCMAFTVQVRPENYLLPLLFFAGLAIYRVRLTRTHLAYLAGLSVLLAALTLPNFLEVLSEYGGTNFVVSDTRGAMTGSNWSLANLKGNLRAFGPDLFNTRYQPLAFTALAALGLGVCAVRKTRDFLFLCLCLIAPAAVYFTSWLHTMGGGQSRFFMLLCPAPAAFAGLGFLVLLKGVDMLKLRGASRAAVPAGLVLLLALSFKTHIQNLGREYSHDYFMLETAVIERAEKSIPSGCAVVAHAPAILSSTTNLRVMPPEAFFFDPRYSRSGVRDPRECVLFYEDIYCMGWDHDGSLKQCARLTGGYKLEPFLAYTRGTARFRFWRIRGKTAPSPQREIVNSDPAPGALAATRNPSEFVFYFNQSLAPGFMAANVFDFKEIPHTGSYSHIGNRLTFSIKCYDEFLKPGHTYHIRVRPGTAGIAPYTLEFRAGKTLDPNGPPALKQKDKMYALKCR